MQKTRTPLTHIRHPHATHMQVLIRNVLPTAVRHAHTAQARHGNGQQTHPHCSTSAKRRMPHASVSAAAGKFVVGVVAAFQGPGICPCGFQTRKRRCGGALCSATSHDPHAPHRTYIHTYMSATQSKKTRHRAFAHVKECDTSAPKPRTGTPRAACWSNQTRRIAQGWSSLVPAFHCARGGRAEGQIPGRAPDTTTHYTTRAPSCVEWVEAQ